LDWLKNKVCGLNKAKLKEFLFTLMDECDALHSETCELKDACDELKRDIRELEHENKVLKDERIELDIKNLVLHEDLERIQESFRMKEENLVTNLTKLKKESLELKQKAESLLAENNKLHEKIKQAEIDQATNRHWNDFSQALNWLNNNQGKKGLGFMKKHTVYPYNRKYVGLPENIVCFHCGKTGHVRYTYPSRKHALERNLGYVKQIWVRKEDLSILKRMGPKKIWVPKTDH